MKTGAKLPVEVQLDFFKGVTEVTRCMLTQVAPDESFF